MPIAAARSAVLAIALAGCAGELPEGPERASPVAAEDSPRAFFRSYPEGLFDAFALTCGGPGQSTVRPADSEIRCESLPPVEAAAALILAFDGTVDDLPRAVTSVASQEAQGGFVVTADTYIRVPQKDGGARIVRQRNAERDAVIRQLLTRAGGDPI
ncbi:hypothetical protein [Histidinibacterium aquaticum]|uniref:Uncharacterized protein n=1 Tax=Histidinibacterium aquaticum TaxID=2613962 RepID=A0A5J5GLP5_9RHOB|nr:hypothetical protein [Histidinibacterium aquaticum]KAA9009060.1 hypothetical protein F3S47_07330 [Histidinibacterium aquaticum]